MPTVIDSLVVELGLDPKNFTQSQQKALDQLRKFQTEAAKAGKEIEASQRRVGESLNQMKREVLGFLGLSFGGAAARQFFDFVTNLDAAIGRTSKTLGISTRELSAWQGAVEQSGGSAQSITGAMQGLSGAMQQLVLTGNASFVPLFNRLGISLYQRNGQLKTSAMLMLDLAKAMEGIVPVRAHALLSMVTGMNEDTINLLLRGRAAVEGYLDAARKAGATSASDAAAAQAFNEQLVLLERTATQTGRAIVQGLLPGLTWFLDKYKEVLQLWNNAPAWVKRLAAPVDPIGGALAAVQGLGGGGGAAGGGGAGGGLSVKPGAGASSPFTDKVSGVLAGVPGIDRVTSLNDPFHQALGRDSQHKVGRAIDLSDKPGYDPQAVVAAAQSALDQAGVGAKVAFHQKGQFGATADHIHVGATPGAGAAAAASSTINNRGGDTTSNSTSIGTIVIHAEGGSSGEIAGGIGPAIRRQNLAAPFNAGQQ